MTTARSRRRRTALRIAVAMLVVAAAVGTFYRSEIHRLWRFANLFREDLLVENFRSMEVLFPTRRVRRGGPVYAFERAPAALPTTFPYGGRDVDLEEFLARRVTTGLLVVQDDAIRHERYFLGNGPETRTISWSVSPLVLIGIAAAVAGLIVLSVRQLTAGSPFIPKEFLRSSRYVALVGMSSTVMAAYIAPIIALPVLLTVFHDLSPLEVGLAMVPGAILTSLFGVFAGRLTDRRGSRLPTRIGAPLMLLAVLGLSSSTGSSVWIIAAFTGVLGAGFGLMNTPLPAAISRIVRGPMLASALSINSMLFFIGGGLGTAVVMAVATSRGGPGASPLNPLHSGAAAGFSDGFLLLAIPVFVAIALSLKLPGAAIQAATEGAEPEIAVNRNWVPSCSVPWMPECDEVRAAEPVPVEG